MGHRGDGFAAGCEQVIAAVRIIHALAASTNLTAQQPNTAVQCTGATHACRTTPGPTVQTVDATGAVSGLLPILSHAPALCMMSLAIAVIVLRQDCTHILSWRGLSCLYSRPFAVRSAHQRRVCTRLVARTIRIIAGFST